MAHLFNVTVVTGSERVVQIVAESAEEAQAKAAATAQEGEQVTTIDDRGEVVL